MSVIDAIRYRRRTRKGDVEEVVGYIAQQASQHRVLSFQEEFRRLLDAHGIPYDERYVWD